MKNPEDSDASVPNSKAKMDIEMASLENLKEAMLCVSCMDKPKCMLINTCKHVPFCGDCDKNFALRCAEDSKKMECPICRKEYKKTTRIKIL